MLRLQQPSPHPPPTYSRPRAHTSATAATTQPLRGASTTPSPRSQAERSLLSVLEQHAASGPNRLRAQSLSAAQRPGWNEQEPPPLVLGPTPVSADAPSRPRLLRTEASLDISCDLETLVERSIALQASPPRRSQIPRRAARPHRPSFSTSPSTVAAASTSQAVYDSSSSSCDSYRQAQEQHDHDDTGSTSVMCCPRIPRKTLHRRATAPVTARPTTPTPLTTTPPSRVPMPTRKPVLVSPPTPGSGPRRPPRASPPIRPATRAGLYMTPSSYPSRATSPRPTSPRPKSPRPVSYPPLASAATLAAATSSLSSGFTLRPTSNTNASGSSSGSIASRRGLSLSRPSSPVLHPVAVMNHTVIQAPLPPQLTPTPTSPGETPTPSSARSGRSRVGQSPTWSRPQSPMSVSLILTPEGGEPAFDIERAARRLRGQTGRVSFREVLAPPDGGEGEGGDADDEEEVGGDGRKRPKLGRRWSLW